MTCERRCDGARWMSGEGPCRYVSHTKLTSELLLTPRRTKKTTRNNVTSSRRLTSEMKMEEISGRSASPGPRSTDGHSAITYISATIVDVVYYSETQVWDWNRRSGLQLILWEEEDVLFCRRDDDDDGDGFFEQNYFLSRHFCLLLRSENGLPYR